jgi:hypothetical protein
MPEEEEDGNAWTDRAESSEGTIEITVKNNAPAEPGRCKHELNF